MRCHCGGEMVTMTRVAELAREQLELATRIGEHAESDGPTRMRVPSGLWIALHSRLLRLALLTEECGECAESRVREAMVGMLQG